MSFLRINRIGNILASKTSKNQCKKVGQKAYSYHVCISCTATNIDENEFIIDHFDIHKEVIKIFRNEMSSCEGMVKIMARELEKLLTNHGIHVIDLYIKLHPKLKHPFEKPVAFMEYSKSGNFI